MINFGIKLKWAIVMKKEDLDESWADEYLNSEPGTKMIHKEEMVLDDIPVVVFQMDTHGITIPPRFRSELNLKAALDNKYIFFPMEK